MLQTEWSTVSKAADRSNSKKPMRTWSMTDHVIENSDEGSLVKLVNLIVP